MAFSVFFPPIFFFFWSACTAHNVHFSMTYCGYIKLSDSFAGLRAAQADVTHKNWPQSNILRIALKPLVSFEVNSKFQPRKHRQFSEAGVNKTHRVWLGRCEGGKKTACKQAALCSPSNLISELWLWLARFLKASQSMRGFHTHTQVLTDEPSDTPSIISIMDWILSRTYQQMGCE